MAEFQQEYDELVSFAWSILALLFGTGWSGPNYAAAGETGHQWERALVLLDEIGDFALQPNDTTLNPMICTLGAASSEP